jgi:CubicO group peptidase (beta-lactamase class C family)
VTPAASVLAGSLLLLAATGAGAQVRIDVDTALDSANAETREAGLDRIIESHDAEPARLDRIGALLDDHDQDVAGKAARALSVYGAAAFPRIEALLRDGSPGQRWGATVALYDTNADIAPFLPTLTRQLSEQDDLLLRATLAALSRVGAAAATALPALAPLLAHEESEIRWATLVTAAGIGPAASDLLTAIEPLLRDESTEVRLAAANAVVHIRPPAPIPSERLAADIAWLRERVPVLMQKHHVPGVSIALIQRNAVSWAQGFGVRDARGNDAVDVETIFEACSMSKPVMALGALRLVQDGRLDLDAPLVPYLGHDYLPDQPAHRLITARMALTHRTGLPNWRMGYAELDGPLPLLFPPGSESTYSGEGILFLQRSMEAIVDEPLERYAEETLFAPLGLTHTSFVWTERIEHDLASGHDENGAFKERTHYRKADAAYSLYTTPTDYARLMLTLATADGARDGFFTRASIDTMLRREQRVEDYDAVDRPGLARSVATYRALAWSVAVTAEGDIAQHSGSNSSGFKTFGQFNRGKGSGLVIFTNGEGGTALREAIVSRIGDL